MEDLMKIIKWRDEIREIEYTIDKLIEAERNAVDEELYERAQLFLQERGRLISRKKYLTTKIKNK
tara:strand:- start:975 stop:1169 length:195 start_codon:yes stop_codon:yes gene_type:complete